MEQGPREKIESEKLDHLRSLKALLNSIEITKGNVSYAIEHIERLQAEVKKGELSENQASWAGADSRSEVHKSLHWLKQTIERFENGSLGAPDAPVRV